MAQISSAAFEYLFASFTAQYNKNPCLLNGYKPIAYDGADIDITPNQNDKESYFNHENANAFNQLHLNAMYDLIDRIYTNVIIQLTKIENKHKAFCDMVDRYIETQKIIFIINCGYGFYNNLAHVEKGDFFLFQCKHINSIGILSESKDKLPINKKRKSSA